MQALKKMIIASLFAPLMLNAESADTILTGGKILTVDKQFSIVESLAIRDGKIIAVGKDKELGSLKGKQTKVIELGGKTVIPGLIDNHFHFIRSVWNSQFEVRLDGINSRKQALQTLKEKAQQAPKGSWVTVIGGWSSDQFFDDNRPFTLTELDAVSNEHPVFLLKNYLGGFANSRAFQKVGLDNQGSASINGRKNMTPFINKVNWRNKSSDKTTIKNYMNQLNAVGLTAVYDVGRASDGNLAPLHELATEQQLPLRVFNSLRYDARDEQSASEAIALIKAGKVRPFSNSDQAGVIGLGEHIYTPVSDSPKRSDSWPMEPWTPFSEIAYAAASSGWTVHEHVMSYATAVQYLELIEKISKRFPEIKNLRWTIAHANGMSEAEINKAKQLGVAIGVHSQASMRKQTQNKPLVGTIAKSGVLWGLGSDAAIVAPISPFYTLHWVISGKTIAGNEGWSEDQRVSREEALKAHTIYNAQLLFMEDKLGSLEVGKLADLVVLDTDYLKVETDKIAAIKPIMTITNGQVVYQQ